jgi:hypothetical protein
VRGACLVSYAILAAVAASASSVAADESLRIAVGADQRATIVGSSNSVRTALERLAWHAHFEITSYDAADRSFELDLEDRPLTEVLASLLRQESYVLGMRGERIASIQVLGDHNTAARRRTATASTPPDALAQIPPALTRAAFASEDPRVRQDALRTIVERVTSSPTERRAFLALDPQAMARAIVDYPHADPMLRELEPSIVDAELRAKLGEIRRALGTLPSPGARR